MYLRYAIDGLYEIAEITRMYYKEGKAYFTLVEGSTLCASGIVTSEWNRLVSDMFSDGKLSLASSSAITVRFIG